MENFTFGSFQLMSMETTTPRCVKSHHSPAGENESDDQLVAPHLYASQPWAKAAGPSQSAAPSRMVGTHRTYVKKRKAKDMETEFNFRTGSMPVGCVIPPRSKCLESLARVANTNHYQAEVRAVKGYQIRTVKVWYISPLKKRGIFGNFIACKNTIFEPHQA